MAKKEEGEGAFLDIDIDELKAQLNLPENTDSALIELGKRFERLNGALGELLLYMNAVDERVQRLAGEPVVTTLSQSHIGADGIAGLHRMRPSLPENITNPHETRANRGKETQSPKIRKSKIEDRILPPVVSK